MTPSQFLADAPTGTVIQHEYVSPVAPDGNRPTSIWVKQDSGKWANPDYPALGDIKTESLLDTGCIIMLVEPIVAATPTPPPIHHRNE